MVFFKANKIFLDEETAAEQLRRRRQERGIKLEEAARAVNINAHYLKALESGEYEKLPAGLYGRNFLREYAFFLKLDSKKILNDFDKETGIAAEDKKNVFSRQIVRKRYLLSLPKILKGFLIAAVAFVCLFYLGYGLKKVFTPPLLELYYPPADLAIQKNSLIISGRADEDAQVFINGEAVTKDSYGFFEKKVSLKEGVNSFIIKAQRKFGRENVAERQILVSQ